MQDEKKGMGSYHAVIEEDALHFLADLAGGDARSALNAVELGILTTPRSEDGMIHITLVCSECIQKRVVRYDKTGVNIMIPYPHLLKVCAVLIRMQPYIIWQRCCMRRRY